MADISLAIDLESRDGTLAKGGLLTNCFVEVSGQKARVHKRSGLSLVTALGAGTGQGITSYTNSAGTEILYAAQNGLLYVSDIPTVSAGWTASATDSGFGASGFTGSCVFSLGGYLWSVGGNGATANSYYISSHTTSTVTAGGTNIYGTTTPRQDQAAVTLNQAVYLIGGQAPGGAYQDDVYRTTDGINYTLIQSAAAFGAYSRCKVVVLNSTMYFLGGTDATVGTNSVYSSTDGITWTLITATPGWGGSGTSRRDRFACFVFKGKMWILGGVINGAYQSDVWSSADGSSWTNESATGLTAAYDYVVNVLNGATLLVTGGNNGSQLYKIHTSTDGVAYTGATTVTGVTTFTANGAYGIVFKGTPLHVNGYFSYPNSVTSGGASLGAITVSAGDFVDFARDFGGTQIMARMKTRAYKLTTATSVLTQVTDAQYPAVTVRGCVYLGGSFFVMEPDGTIWNSAEDDCTAWNGNDFIQAEFEPDGGVAIAKYGSFLVAFGIYTTEMFYLSATAAVGSGSPLSPIDSGVFLVGCAHGNSVAQVEGTVIWMAQKKGAGTTFQKGRSIVMLEGTSYKTISTPDICRILDADDLATIYSTVLSLHGHTFYILTLGTSAITLVYDLDQKLWYRWTRGTIGSAVSVSTLTQSSGTATATTGSAHGYSDGDEITIAGATPSGYNLTINVNVTSSTVFTYPVSSALTTPATGTITATGYSQGVFNMVASCNYSNKQVFQEASGGNIYETSEDATDDNSAYIDWHIRTSQWDAGNNLTKFMSSLEVVGDKTSTTALVRYSDNDLSSWSYYKRVTLSDERPIRRRMGDFFRRTFEFRQTTDIAATRLERFEVHGENIDQDDQTWND